MIPHGIERLAVPPHRIGQRLAGFVALAYTCQIRRSGKRRHNSTGAQGFRQAHELCRIPDLDGQLLAERLERGFDLIEPGVVG
jgi:hypothetical protein